MQQFDIVRLTNGSHALLLQADLLDHVASRVLAPIVPATAFKSSPKLHIPVRIGRKDFIVVMERLAAVDPKAIRSVVGSMKHREWDIRQALDLVFVGV